MMMYLSTPQKHPTPMQRIGVQMEPTLVHVATQTVAPLLAEAVQNTQEGLIYALCLCFAIATKSETFISHLR
jgi:hypothetical protein